MHIIIYLFINLFFFGLVPKKQYLVVCKKTKQKTAQYNHGGFIPRKVFYRRFLIIKTGRQCYFLKYSPNIWELLDQNSDLHLDRGSVLQQNDVSQVAEYAVQPRRTRLLQQSKYSTHTHTFLSTTSVLSVLIFLSYL